MFPEVFDSCELNWSVVWTQLSVNKSWSIRERARVTARVDMNNLPFKQPQFAQPNSVYDINSPGTFERFTGVRGDWTNAGSGQPNIDIGLRLEY